MTRIAAVVVAFRDPRALSRCLESLHDMDDVWVVNVTGAPDVSGVIGTYGRREVLVEDNLGYAGAVGVCLSHIDSSVERVLVLNDDVELASDIDIDIDPSADVCIPLVAGASGPDLYRLPTPSGFFLGWVLGRRPVAPPVGDVLPTGLAANGAALLVSRHVLGTEPLPSEYFMYWEETAWFWRLQDAGYRSVVGGFTIRRDGGAEEISELKARQMGINLMRLADERGGRRQTLVIGVIAVLWLIRLLVTDAMHRPYRKRLRARGWLAAGLVRGFVRAMSGSFRRVG